MKRIVILSCMFLFMVTANQVIAQEKIKDKDDKTKVKDKAANYKEKDKNGKVKIKDENGKMKMKDNGMNSTMSYPYTANYSSNFIIGNPANAKLVLDEWKDWDDNALDRHNFMADTIITYMPDGTVTKGKEANMAMWKKFRSGFTSSKSTVDAWMPLTSVDRKENWVAVWGTETDTYADGKIDKHDVHEIWRINKDGKVDFFKQFTAVTSPQQ